MDSFYYHSLQFEYNFDKWETPHAPYEFMGVADGYEYFMSSADEILQRLQVMPARPV
jgi:hypothetical protein